MSTLIARTASRIAVPIILVAAVAFLLQGHNLPGGGFIAAVTVASGFALVYVIHGLGPLQAFLGASSEGSIFGHGPIEWYRLVLAVGLALAAGSGLVPILFGEPFLTQTFVILHHVPLYGEFEVASAIAFDVGVFLTVVGGLLTIVAVVGTE
jgi:multicomponent Na+:H+ antiporter subunit B